MIGRRIFLRALAAVPLAAKAAADDAIGQGAGIKTEGFFGGGMVGRPLATGDQQPMADSTEKYDPWVALDTHVRLMGLPAWQERMIRDQAWNVGALDPDIACKKSWSMSVKIVTQRERNYARLVANIRRNAENSIGRKALMTVLGGYVPYL